MPETETDIGSLRKKKRIEETNLEEIQVLFFSKTFRE